jgi:chemotaxis protein methyltransferase WspC
MLDHLQEIALLLARRIGLDPLAVGPGSIARAVRRQMAEGKFEDVEAYHRRLLESETELGKLIDEVTVPESWFFRDEGPFRWLESHVRKRWLAEPSRAPLRVLSVACSGGEEPYSIAMTLLDLGLPARRFWIDAVDVSARRLAIAQRGVYGRNSFRGSAPMPSSTTQQADSKAQPQARPKPEKGCGWWKHFREHELGLELDPTVRAMVHFSEASVLDPRLLEGSPPYDIVFCRNLLIYFDQAARVNALSAIERLMAADGFLVIGHADRLDSYGDEPRFIHESDAGSFVYRRAVRPVVATGPATTVPRADAQAILGSPKEIPVAIHQTPRTADARAAAEGFKNPTTIHNQTAGSEHKQRLSVPSGDAQVDPQSALERAAGLANRGMFDVAIEECERQIRQKGPSAAGYYLMGMIQQAMGDRGRAEECFQKTAYLEPTHAEALLALALLSERRGELSLAAAYHRRAERAAQAGARLKGDLA